MAFQTKLWDTVFNKPFGWKIYESTETQDFELDLIVDGQPAKGGNNVCMLSFPTSAQLGLYI